uniref:Uncharacterized protein n=1 Tax=Oryza glumipatula TaxID=40148 RepID=A0A0D9ZU27_9ORYZ
MEERGEERRNKTRKYQPSKFQVKSVLPVTGTLPDGGLAGQQGAATPFVSVGQVDAAVAAASAGGEEAERDGVVVGGWWAEPRRWTLKSVRVENERDGLGS